MGMIASMKQPCWFIRPEIPASADVARDAACTPLYTSCTPVQVRLGKSRRVRAVRIRLRYAGFHTVTDSPGRYESHS